MTVLDEDENRCECGHDDFDTFEVREATGYNAAAEDGIVVHVRCKACGAEGNAKIKLDDIMW